MPSIPIYPQTQQRGDVELSSSTNPLPHLLQTPTGLAILEIQGTINVPSPETNDDAVDKANETTSESQAGQPYGAVAETEIGKLIFPDYKPYLYGNEDAKWMKRVYLYVGKYQRLTGEVKRLGKPLAIIRRKQHTFSGQHSHSECVLREEELEIAEIVKYKILFPSRPEPVSLGE